MDQATPREGIELKSEVSLSFPKGLLSGQVVRPYRCVFSLVGWQALAPAHCVPLRVVGRRHFGSRGASGKSSANPHTCPPAGYGLSCPCFLFKALASAVAAFLLVASSNPAVGREPLSTGPGHTAEKEVTGAARSADTPRREPTCHGLGILQRRPVRWGRELGYRAGWRSGYLAGLTSRRRGGRPWRRSSSLGPTWAELECKELVAPLRTPKLEPGGGDSRGKTVF